MITIGPELDSILLTVTSRIDIAIFNKQQPNIHDLTQFGLLTNLRESGNPITPTNPTSIMLQSSPEQINVIIAQLEKEINASIGVSIQPFEQYLLMYGYLLNIQSSGNPLSSGGGGSGSWTGP